MSGREFVVRVLGVVPTGETFAEPTFMQSFNPSTPDGRGDLVLTGDVEKAQVFSSAAEAMALWRTQSSTVPLRPDGQPNRPFTAFTIQVQPKP
jgi:hypothetical protein